MDEIAKTLGQQGWEMVNFAFLPLQTVSTSYHETRNGALQLPAVKRGIGPSCVTSNGLSRHSPEPPPDCRPVVRRTLQG
jgi:hypothetical protein